MFSATKKTWAGICLISIGIIYFNLVWRTTSDLDRLTTELIFYGAICALLWRRHNSLTFNSDVISSFVGLFLLTILLIKTTTLYTFEAPLISLIPFVATVSLALISSGIKGIGQYKKELFFAWFLFFPTGVIGHFIDGMIKITVLNAKIASYLLYYAGFNVATQQNEVILVLPQLGQFKAIVDYPCAGVPMILLMLKLSLLFVFFSVVSKRDKFIIPLVSILIGFTLGVIRVCLLTLLIPQPQKFDYWHGANGSQIFSTLAILIFAGFAYWVLEKNKDLSLTNSHKIT